MKRSIVKNKGFTLVELLIICVVIAILAAIGIVVYQGIQKRAADAAVFKDLKASSEQLGLSYIHSPGGFRLLDKLPDNFQSSADVSIRLVMGYNGDIYENLTPVQQGVLFYTVCEELIANPNYSTIHSKDGKETSSVVMRCTDNISAKSLLITGWDSKTWSTPVTKSTLQMYIDSVPYDNWWVDRQDVVLGFYKELIRLYEIKGGSFPVTSFWDPWANQWSGVQKEALPAPIPPSTGTGGVYCVEAYHAKYPDSIYKITQDDKVEIGAC